MTRTHTGPNAIRFTTPVHMALVLFTAQPGRQIALNSDRPSVGMAPVGALEIVPASSELSAAWAVEKQNLLTAIDPNRLERLAGAEFDKETFELQPTKLGVIDEQAHQIARLMRYEVENAELSYTECIDSLLTLFATHLLRNYSSLGARPSHQPSGGLSPAALHRVFDVVQAQLAETLPVERLASIAGLSPSHFARAFRQTVGQSPHQYVISSRLTRARELITNTDIPLSEIAKSTGFSGHSHMTSVMRRLWRTTPTDFRSN